MQLVAVRQMSILVPSPRGRRRAPLLAMASLPGFRQGPDPQSRVDPRSPKGDVIPAVIEAAGTRASGQGRELPETAVGLQEREGDWGRPGTPGELQVFREERLVSQESYVYSLSSETGHELDQPSPSVNRTSEGP